MSCPLWARGRPRGTCCGGRVCPGLTVGADGAGVLTVPAPALQPAQRRAVGQRGLRPRALHLVQHDRAGAWWYHKEDGGLGGAWGEGPGHGLLPQKPCKGRRAATGEELWASRPALRPWRSIPTPPTPSPGRPPPSRTRGCSSAPPGLSLELWAIKQPPLRSWPSSVSSEPPPCTRLGVGAFQEGTRPEGIGRQVPSVSVRRATRGS